MPPPTAIATPSSAPSPATSLPTDEPPDRDLVDLARRFRGLPANAPLTARETPYGYAVGDREEFAIVDNSAPSLDMVAATVRLVTERAYLFVQEGVEVDASALDRIGKDIDTLVYPRVAAAFGEESSPGVDADPRISIIHVDLNGAGGYVRSTDEFPQLIVPESNERQAIYLDLSFLSSPGSAYNATLAHELQHVIHLNGDGSEDAWVNEGLSQVAAELAGGDTSTVDIFLAAPDTQLTDWPPDFDAVHYGESQLFFRYLLDRFGGRENAAALVAAPGDGVSGVDGYLREFGATFEDVFADWVVANYLDEDSGRYAHEGADVSIVTVTTIGDAGEGDGAVHQFAADYLEVGPPAGSGIFTFDGSDEVGIDIEPRDGPFWWSNTGDSIDSRLTREYDLSGLTSASLRFQTWFQTELGWDYAYVAASRDGGQTWEALPGGHTTDYDPVGTAYGPGYTGDSNGEWLQEEIDLTPYAGGKVLLRFEYVTDDAANARGFAVDNIEIPELASADGADTGSGWQAEGFRRIEGPLAQRFVVQVVERGDKNVVRLLEPGPGNRLEVALDGPATIIVAAVTEGTTESASYRWTLK